MRRRVGVAERIDVAGIVSLFDVRNGACAE